MQSFVIGVKVGKNLSDNPRLARHAASWDDPPGKSFTLDQID